MDQYTIKSIWDGLDWSVLLDLLMRVLPALLCITLHELSHGYVAWRLGDSTARDAGRLTLNPLRHIDIMGLAMMVLFRFGWAKPVPVNMFRFREPKKGMALTALAGPLCNLLLCPIFLFFYGLSYPLYFAGAAVWSYVPEFFAISASLSLSLAVFNLIPIPPLDGSKLLFALLPDSAYLKLMRYERYGMLVLFLLVSTGILGAPLSRLSGWLFDRLFFAARWGFEFVKGLL